MRRKLLERLMYHADVQISEGPPRPRTESERDSEILVEENEAREKATALEHKLEREVFSFGEQVTVVLGSEEVHRVEVKVEGSTYYTFVDDEGNRLMHNACFAEAEMFVDGQVRVHDARGEAYYVDIHGNRIEEAA